MIATVLIEEVRRLLDERDLSQRKIADRVGVSRGTVNAIALGKRPDYKARRQEQGGDLVPPAGLPIRCPGCGGMVQMPCLLCRVRAIRTNRRRGGNGRPTPVDGKPGYLAKIC